MSRLNVYEEQLYELFMYLRNYGKRMLRDTAEPNLRGDILIPKANERKKNLDEDALVDSIIEKLQEYVSAVH